MNSVLLSLNQFWADDLRVRCEETRNGLRVTDFFDSVGLKIKSCWFLRDKAINLMSQETRCSLLTGRI